MIHHSEIIADLARVYQPKVYVELGLYVGETWYKVIPHAEKSFGVDTGDIPIQGGEIYRQATDEFFQHMKDLKNASQLLNPQGVIIVHDTDPESDSLFDKGYCGDSYKLVEFLKDSEEYNSVTLPVAEAGLTIITKKNNTRVYNRGSTC